MTKTEFFALADTVFDHEATQNELTTFESIVEQNPEWMDEWVDQKTALQSALGCQALEASPNFVPSLVARWRAQKIRLSLNYWTPAALAAVAAAIGLIAVLQIMSMPIQSTTFGKPEAEAKLESTDSIPFPSLSEPLNR